MNARILGVVVLLLWFPLTAGAQGEGDARAYDSINSSLRSYTRLTIFDDVSFQVQSGIVTLTGKVTMAFKRDDVERRVAAVAGVLEVRNQIEVLPVSVEDDELRKRVARAIYGNPAFYRYAAMPHPPIHIVVENGRVTLTGIVPSEVDRMLARSLATGQGERSVVCALRTTAEAREG